MSFFIPPTEPSLALRISRKVPNPGEVNLFHTPNLPQTRTIFAATEQQRPLPPKIDNNGREPLAHTPRQQIDGTGRASGHILTAFKSFFANAAHRPEDLVDSSQDFGPNLWPQRSSSQQKTSDARGISDSSHGTHVNQWIALRDSASKTADSGFSTPLGSTPPQTTGFQTPQPDTHDKRLPNILSSYFSQVRESFHPTAKSTDMGPTAPASPPPESEGLDRAISKMSLDQMLDAGDAPPEPMSSQHTAPSPPPQEKMLHPVTRQEAAQHPYPTPPLSSSSSYTILERPESSGDALSGSSSPREAGDRSPGRRQSALDGLPANLRRSTFSTKPSTANPSMLTSTPDILASHISQPATLHPSISRHSASASDQLSASLRGSEDQRLTENAAVPRNQTPPRSPRSQSQSQSQSQSTTRKSTPTSPPSQRDAPASPPNGATHEAVVGEPKGQLSIRISSGRGLRPSVDPYVVCQFQCNEYISKGPQNDGGNLSEPSGPIESLRKSPVPMQRSDSDSGRPMAIPMKSRQSSQTSTSGRESSSQGREVTDPVWNHEAMFDVVGDHTEVVVSVYDRSQQEAFLGYVRFCPNLDESSSNFDQWLKLQPRESNVDQLISGEVHLQLRYQKVEKKHYGPEDFQILKLIGKGTFGQVYQVRKHDTQRVYAMKVLSKKVIVQKKEVAHTVGERNILVRTAMTDSPFIVGLKFSFQTPTDLYLVTDYMSGGELFWHLQKESRFHEDRAKFYIAELILALQHLHQHDIVYRDLKPENILLDANGHIALCDFGLSKANLTKDDTTNTFCGTTEYLAPEVLLDESGYTKMVDFWSLGVLVFEMVCGWSPFYAEDTQQMYKNIAFGKVRFPRDALSTEGRNFVKGLLNRNPKHRLGANGDAEELKSHQFFRDVDWDALGKKALVPPFKPRLKSETDTSNFDPEFTNALNGASSLNARAAALANGGNSAQTPLSPTMQANFRGFTFVDESVIAKQAASDDAMDESGDVRGWDAGPPSPTFSRSSRRMSGVQSTTGTEEPMFGMG